MCVFANSILVSKKVKPILIELIFFDSEIVEFEVAVV